MLHLHLLGPLRVHDGEERDLTPSGSREQLCLATLAVVAPTGLSTERLASELYRERPTTDPRNAVQAVVSRLRRALGQQAGAIETTATGYRMVDVELDIDRVEQLLTDAGREQDPAAAQRLLDRAGELWPGPILDGARAGELIEAEQIRLDGLRAGAVETVAGCWLAAGGNDGLVAGLESAVAADPLRERRWELLMLALYRDGRQAEALRAYQRARTILAERLGLAPGPALTQLEQQILAHDPALDPPVGAPAPLPPPPEPLPAGTVTVLLCDVQGSVRRWEQAPEATASDIDDLHRIWRRAVEVGGGRLVKSTGDGVLAAFPTARGAVEAAVAAMGEQERGPLDVRAAIHTGTIAPVGDDYRGPVVNRCARLLELAGGGQILVSGPAAELARPDLGPPVALRDLGLQWLRDVGEPISVWQVEGPGLRRDFPPLTTRGPASLPRLRGALLGRDELVDEVVTLAGEEPLVTLLGPGGIGKTSIALAAGWRVAGSRPVVFVDLAGISDPATVADRLADQLGAGDRDPDREPVDRVVDRLRASTDLVIVDNAEHLLETVATLIDGILRNELKGSFLVTSRQPLGLEGEAIVGVPPLALPDDGADLESTGRSPSVRLFLERIRAARPDAVVPAGLLPVVAHICRRLDGLPLAIELAAGRASLLSVDDIAARLDDQLRLLRQVRSSRERRHRSLEAVVGWSVDQLSRPARELFIRLSIMSGSFGIAGVEQLIEHCGLDWIEPLEALDELCGASLVGVESTGSRFRLLEPVRQIAAAELAARGVENEHETRRAHARWMIDLVTAANDERGKERRAAMALVDAEADQLRSAVAWIGDVGDVGLATAIAFPSSWWFLTRDAHAGQRLIGRLLDLVDRDREPLAWAGIVLAVGVVTAGRPQSDLAGVTLDAVAIYDEVSHRDAGLARIIASYAQLSMSDAALRARLVGEAEQLVPAGDRWASAVVDMSVMMIHGLELLFDPETPGSAEAVARGERAVKVFRDMGETWAVGVSLSELGRIHQRRGDLDVAEARYTESLGLFDASGFHGSHYVFTELGRLTTARGDHELAQSYHQRALEITEIDGPPVCLAGALAGLGHAAEARGDLDEALDHYRRAVSICHSVDHADQELTGWEAAIDRLAAGRR